MSQMRLFGSKLVKKCIYLLLQQHKGTNHIFCVSPQWLNNAVLSTKKCDLYNVQQSCSGAKKWPGCNFETAGLCFAEEVSDDMNLSNGLGSLYVKIKV